MTDFAGESKFMARKPSASGVSAFLTVQEGCDKFCSFCVVPYTRGAEFSRPVADILAEARTLAASGVKELTLLGQNVNAYRGIGLDGAPASLANLCWALAKIEGLMRIRYVTSHPRDMSDDLLDAHAENEKLMPYLHLPIQAGSDKVLKAMNRGHTAENYIRLIERLRRVRPDIALSGDFIVGFPGETERDFEATLAVVREVTYASAFSFKYSERPGTPAADRKDQVPEEEKADRLARLQNLLLLQQHTFNEACVGRVLPVLVEKPGRNPGQMIGRSPYLQSVNATLPASSTGQIIDLKITKVGPNSLSGQYRPATASLNIAEGVPAH
jgi:tRNA-2-methylthio-N6-dimethylallyladenosine synthase